MALTTTSAHDDTDLAARRRRGAALIVGGLAMLLLVQTGAVKFYYTPLIVGLTYLIGAAVSGRRGALWAPGIVTTCWGISVLLSVHGVVSNPHYMAFNIAAAIGVVLALTLRATVGIAAGVVGLVVSVGVILLHDYLSWPSWVFHGATFAALLGIWGLWEMRPDRHGTTRGNAVRKPATASTDESSDLSRV